MSFKLSWLGIACLFVALVWATSAQAQTNTYSISGNSRTQIGNGLPIPIGFTPVPDGRIQILPGQFIQQTTGPDPKQMTLLPSGATAPGNKVVLPLKWSNSGIFQIATAFAIQAPGVTATLRASGRTGPPVVTWCPGLPVPTASYNPSCSTPPTPGAGPVPGLMRYTRTANQFGGVSQGHLAGPGTLMLNAAGVALPCDFNTGTCIAAIANVSPAPTAAIGGAFGWFNATSNPAPSPGAFNAIVLGGGYPISGYVVYLTSPGLGPGLGNPATSFGGPWTTGRVTIRANSTINGSYELFTITGSDNRVNGLGSISLVAGSVSQRGVSGPNANRGWMNLVISTEVPTTSSHGILWLTLLLAGGGLWLVRRKVVTA